MTEPCAALWEASHSLIHFCECLMLIPRTPSLPSVRCSWCLKLCAGMRGRGRRRRAKSEDSDPDYEGERSERSGGRATRARAGRRTAPGANAHAQSHHERNYAQSYNQQQGQQEVCTVCHLATESQPYMVPDLWGWPPGRALHSGHC